MAARKHEGEVGRVKLVLQPPPDRVPSTTRLRRALKCLLRSFGLRCVSIEPALEPEPEDEKEN